MDVKVVTAGKCIRVWTFVQSSSENDTRLYETRPLRVPNPCPATREQGTDSFWRTRSGPVGGVRGLADGDAL